MPEEGAARQPGEERGWLGVILTVVLALAVGAAAVAYWRGTEGSVRGNAGAGEPTVVLEPFIVNLNTTQRAFLRAGITLGLRNPLPRNQPAALPTGLVRDTILAVLSTAKPEDLLKPEGKRQLKDELLQALQRHVPDLAVQNVYFTDFLVQM